MTEFQATRVIAQRVLRELNVRKASTLILKVSFYQVHLQFLFYTLKYTKKIFQLSEKNECIGEPCYNGGTCNDMLNGFQCTCVAGKTGVRCSDGKFL